MSAFLVLSLVLSLWLNVSLLYLLAIIALKLKCEPSATSEELSTRSTISKESD